MEVTFLVQPRKLSAWKEVRLCCKRDAERKIGAMFSY